MTTATSLTTVIETITPDIAQAYLDTNTHNRKVRQDRVRAYSTSISEGRWTLTGDSIKFDTDGKLADGQHRLLACIDADEPFVTLVVRGVPVDAVPDTDRGLNRTYADLITYAGKDGQFNGKIAAAARIILGWREGILRYHRSMNFDITQRDIVTFSLDHYDALSAAVQTAQAIHRQTSIPRGVAAAFVFEATLLSPAHAAVFTDKLITGAGLGPTNPILALRNWAVSTSLTGRKRGNDAWTGAAVKMWNAWGRGEEVRLCRWADNETVGTLTVPTVSISDLAAADAA